MNSSSLSKAVFLIVGGLVIVVGLGIFQLLQGQMIVVIGSLVAALCFAISLFLILQSRNATRAAKDVCEAVAAGNLDMRILHAPGTGLQGDLFRAINSTLDQFEAFAKEAGAVLDYVSRGRYFRRIILTGMHGNLRTYATIINRGVEATDERTKDFVSSAQLMGASVKDIVNLVASESEHLEVSSKGMTDLASETSSQSATVAQAAATAADNVQTIAAAAEELSASIGAMTAQITHSSEIAETAMVQAGETEATIKTLSEAADRIGEVVTLINDIAEQTNLLALNATIEAARAGDAGKGFAVVANEVKNLAKQTARATDEIVTQINQMQGATKTTVNAIHDVSSTIQDINAISAEIAHAVEEQHQAVNEISHSINDAVRGVNTVSETITAVADGATITDTTSNDVYKTAVGLHGRADTLNEKLDAFVRQVSGNNAA